MQPTPPRVAAGSGTMRAVGEAVVVTYLELSGVHELRPAAPARMSGLEIGRVDPPDGGVSASLYAAVGGPYAWSDHSERAPQEWQAWAEQVETWIATVAGERAGYYELRADGADVEIAHLGLLQAFHGAGIGGQLLTDALRRALRLGDRVWVHTCTLDGPAALPNYVARGMRPYRTRSAA
jgi:GNAT superfamily N-acetyltransferase